MGIYEELQARGLIAQVTNEPEIREMVDNGKATFYIGFDPTADSPARGPFHGTVPHEAAPDGGQSAPSPSSAAAPAMIGDPSGRTRHALR